MTTTATPALAAVLVAGLALVLAWPLAVLLVPGVFSLCGGASKGASAYRPVMPDR